MLPIAHVRKHDVCKLWIFFIVCTVLFSHSLFSQNLVWQEEFNSSTLNPNFWTYDFGDGCSRNLCGWGNAELQNYTTRPENVRIENGNLIIEGRRENYGNSSFTSGRVKTEGRIHFKYGTVEARIKIPNLANGLWPAFWTLGTIGGIWPNIGEIDMMEMGSQSARFASLINKQVSAATHWSSNGSQADAVGIINAPSELNNDYHLYKMVWTSQSITMYLDGVNFFTMDISNPSSTSKEEFHNPHFLLLNMAIGGSYTGLLNSSDINATLPAQMLVDYVRLYQNPGDELYVGSNNITSGNYGVFTETATVTDFLTMGSNATLNFWNNLSVINGATAFEGSHLWAIRANAGSWFGMGLDNKYINLSAHTNGSLKFNFKSSYNGQFKFGLKTGDGESWINFSAGSNQYGLIRDGQWHEVSIPLSDFYSPSNGRYFDANSVKSAFMFAGDAPSVIADFYIDNIYFTKNTVSPTLGSFTIPSKYLGDTAFTLTPPSSNSSGAFSYSSSNQSVATIIGNKVSIVGAGTANITATQSAFENYGSASITAPIVVTILTPNIAAPSPPSRASSDYVAIYSDAYTNVVGTDFNPYWNQTTLVSNYVVNSNNIKKYDQFNYQGIQLSGIINVANMQYVHIDIWTPNCTGFDLYLINTSPFLVEQKFTVTPSLNGWNSYDIPLSQFSSVALNNISQFKLEARPSSTTILYWDNLYFWKSSNLLPPTLNVTQPNCNNSTGTITVTSSTSGLIFSNDGVNYNNTNGVFLGLTPGTYQISSKNSLGLISGSTTATINSSPSIPSAPSIISGVVNINQCDTLQTYSVTYVDAVSYVWTVTGTGNLIKSGQGNSNVVMAMKVGGTIAVKASNVCGLSTASTLNVIKSMPATPSTVSYNSTNVCGYTNSAYLFTGIKDTFRVKKVINAVGYIWEIPSGATYQTLNDTSIVVLFPDTISLTTSSPRYVKVYSKSSCDTSLAKSITLTRTIITSPVAIQNSFVPSIPALTNVAGVDSTIYMIRKVAGASSYNWYLKSGVKAVLYHLNPLGPNDTIVKIKFISGFNKDTLCVSSVDGCTTSASKTVVMSAMAAPPAPTAISGSLTPCIGQSLTYKSTAGITSSATAPTSKYRWTLPSATATTLVSSNSDSSEIIVRFNAGFTGGSISVKAVSAIGVLSSTAFSATLKYTAATPSAITSSSGGANYCIGAIDTFKVTAPTLTAAQAPASIYRWTKPNNTSILYSNIDSSIVVLAFNTGYAGGALTVRSQTICGILSTAKSLTLTHTGCPSGLRAKYFSTSNESDDDSVSVNVYPNPCRNYFNVELNSTNKNKSNINFCVYNLYGQLIKKTNAITVNGKVNEKFYTGDMPNGVYFMKFDCKNKKQSIVKIFVNKQ